MIGNQGHLHDLEHLVLNSVGVFLGFVLTMEIPVDAHGNDDGDLDVVEKTGGGETNEHAEESSKDEWEGKAEMEFRVIR